MFVPAVLNKGSMGSASLLVLPIACVLQGMFLPARAMQMYHVLCQKLQHRS